MKAFNKLVNPGDLPNTLTQYLQDQRQNKIAAANTIKIKKGKRLAVEAGKSVKTEDLEAILEASVPAKKKAKKGSPAVNENQTPSTSSATTKTSALRLIRKQK